VADIVSVLAATSAKRGQAMSSRTYICVPCRWSRRAAAAYGLNTNLRCPNCAGPLWELSWRWRIPRKSDDKAWKELEAKVAREAAEWFSKRERLGQTKLAKIDRRIAALKGRTDSPGVHNQVQKLHSQRRRVQTQYAAPSAQTSSSD
jgi:hypothetical protein